MNHRLYELYITSPAPSPRSFLRWMIVLALAGPKKDENREQEIRQTNFALNKRGLLKPLRRVRVRKRTFKKLAEIDQLFIKFYRLI